MSNYDVFRRVVNHEANQDDGGGFFAKLGGIEPEHDDAPTAKGLFQHMDFNQPGTPVYAAKPANFTFRGHYSQITDAQNHNDF